MNPQQQKQQPQTPWPNAYNQNGNSTAEAHNTTTPTNVDPAAAQPVNNPPGAIAASQPINADNTTSSLFVSAARRLTARENPLASYSSFCFLYSSFFDWCCSTVPPMSCSLREIAFVVFVELWSRLLPVSEKKAQSFLKKFGDPHFIAHHAEITEMRKITSIINIRDTSFVSRVIRGEKFHMHVGLLTRKLLTTRLTMENDTVILDILQKRIQFETPSEKGPISPDGSLAILATKAFRSPVSRDVGGAIVTPSLTILSGLLPPDLGSKSLDTSFKPFIPEPEATQLAPQLAALYRTPISARINAGENSNPIPALDWRLDVEAERRYRCFLKRAEVGPDLLPSALEFKIKEQKLRGAFNNGSGGQLHLHTAVVNPVGGGQIAVGDNRTSLWLFDVSESQWARTAGTYEEALINPWAASFVESAREKCVDDALADDLRLIIRNKELTWQSDPNAALGAGGGPRLEKQVQPNQGVRCLTGHSMAPISFKFLPPFLTSGAMSLGLSASYDEKMILWDLRSSVKLHTYKTGSAVNAIDVDPFGYLYGSAHQDRAACLWSMDRNNPLRVLPRHYSAVESISFHPNSLLLATGSADESRLRLWDPRVPDIVGAITGIQQPRIVTFSPNGRLICVGGYSNIVHIWDIVAAKLFAMIDLSGSGGGGSGGSGGGGELASHQRKSYPLSISFSNNSKLLATCCTHGIVRLWDPAHGNRGLSPEADQPMIDLTVAFQGDKQSTDSQKLRPNVLQEIRLKNSKAIGAQFTESNVLIIPSAASPNVLGDC